MPSTEIGAPDEYTGDLERMEILSNENSDLLCSD